MNKLARLAALLALVAGLSGIAQADGGGSGTAGPHIVAPALPSILVVLFGVYS